MDRRFKQNLNPKERSVVLPDLNKPYMPANLCLHKVSIGKMA